MSGMSEQPRTPSNYRKFVARLPAGEREVEVARDGEAYRLRTGGKEIPLTWTDHDGGRSLLQVGGRPVEIRIHNLGDSTWRIDWNGRQFTLRVEDDLAARARKAHAHHGGPVTLRSPMPGTVVKVLVEEGADVTLEQPVLIIEAMKMQNELVAPISGTVEEVRVQPGQAVDGDQALLLIKP